MFYPFTEPISITNPVLALSIAGVIGITIIVLLTQKRTKEITFAWFFFLITVLPTLTNFTKGDNMLIDVYIASDRYAYIPSIAILFLMATAMHHFKEKFRRMTFWVSTVVIMAFGFLTYHQSLMWKDTAFLFLNVIQYYDNSHHAHNSVGVELENRGFIDHAKREYEKALEIRPNEKAYYNLGRIYRKKEMYIESRASFLEALKMNQFHVNANVEFGELMLVMGKPKETLKLTEFALEFEPNHIKAIEYTIEAYERLGNAEKVAEYRERLDNLDID